MNAVSLPEKFRVAVDPAVFVTIMVLSYSSEVPAVLHAGEYSTAGSWSSTVTTFVAIVRPGSKEKMF